MVELLAGHLLLVTILSSVETKPNPKPDNYVCKLLSLYLPQQLNLPLDALKYITRIAKVFHNKSLMKLKVTKFPWVNDTLVDCEATPAHFFHLSGLRCFVEYFKVVQPTGHLVQSRLLTHRAFCGGWPYCSEQWQFLLFPFSGNMTFHRIYFSSGSFDCCKGSLTALGSPNVQDKLIFCGYFPKFSFYPHSPEASLQRMSQEYTIFEFHMSYQIIDSDQLKSKKVTPNVFGVSVIEVTMEQQKQCTNFVIRIQAKKTRKLIILAQETLSLEAFDGPGELSNQIFTEHGVYASSTFQCWVKFTVLGSHTKYSNATIRFRDKTQNNERSVSLSENETLFMHLSNANLMSSLLWF